MAEHYHAKHGKTPGSVIAVRIVIIVLVAALLAGGAWGVFRFVINPAMTAPTEPNIPTIAQEVTLQPIPTHPPTEAAPDYDKMASDTLSKMSLDEKIAQLFVVTPETLTGVDVAVLAGDTTREMLEKYPVGGIIYTTPNMEDKDQLKELVFKTQSYSKLPLIICVDEEGGDVARVADALDEEKLEPMFSYKDEDVSVAKKNAKTIASYLTKYGFNTDLAPVADVWTNKDNTVIAERAYSDDYQKAAERVAAAVKGYDESGIAATLKHFPGHGDSAEDSHDEIAILDKTYDEIKDAELLPFKQGIKAGADMVMIGHISVPSLDEEKPATLSKTIVPDILRKDMKYDGVVISDSLTMGALVENYTTDEIVQGLFDADIDLFLMPGDLDEYIGAINTALENKTVTEDQIDKKVARILKMKYERGIIPTEQSSSQKSTQPSTQSSTQPETQPATQPATQPSTKEPNE
ncbi:MAG: glycoside hydrolase family 3 [Ruminococcus sp.]|nr:glycoside hydrolase family 3 [Ruminococcus sp.]